MTARKLSVLAMDEIRARYAQGLVTVASLAREYHVGETTIKRVLSEAPSEYGKARRKPDAKYSTSEAGRARRRRADKAYHDAGKARARKYKVQPENITKLIEKQGGVCPITGKPITSKSHVDHSHDPGLSPVDALRGVIHGQINACLPNDDAGLVKFASNLSKYAGARIKLRAYLACKESSKK